MKKNNFLTVSWLSGLLSAEIFISTGEWGVQMPPLTSENSYFLRSGPQGATLVMHCSCSLHCAEVEMPFPSDCQTANRAPICSMMSAAAPWPSSWYPSSLRTPGGCSLTFCKLPKILSRNLRIAEMVLMRISSLNFQFEILTLNGSSGIAYFHEIILESS